MIIIRLRPAQTMVPYRAQWPPPGSFSERPSQIRVKPLVVLFLSRQHSFFPKLTEPAKRCHASCGTLDRLLPIDPQR
jgi:hypothetical protein